MKHLKVLVVDDDPDFAEGIGLSLGLDGHEVVYASSGQEAIRKFRAGDIDVTLMDVNMPGMNGVETLRGILNVRHDAKVVMVTAYSVEKLLRQALAGGALGVLQKPIRRRDLTRTFRDIQAAGIVLLADDDPDFVSGIATILSNEGYTVLKARNGQEAMDAVIDNSVDVLLLDIRMPDLSGLEVFSELRKRGCAPPTIVVTGYSEEESATVQEMLQASAKACLVKPIASDDLLQAVNAAL